MKEHTGSPSPVPVAAPVRLDRNECFFPHPPEVLEALGTIAANVNAYGKGTAHEALRADLAGILNTDPALITLAHGAEDLLIKILCWQRSRTHALVTSDFSWSNYQNIADGLGYVTYKIPCLETRDGFETDVKALRILLESLRDTRCAVLLTSPNNPTGHDLPAGEVATIVRDFPDHLFVIDGVYDLLDSPHAALASECANCCFLGSFSKFFGLPGLRVGYSVGGSLPQAFQLALGLQPFALTACRVALANRAFYAANRAEMMEFAACLQTFAGENWQPFPTRAPFVLVKLTRWTEEACAQAEAASGVRPKYLTRHGTHFLRWGLGPRVLNERIVDYLLKFDEALAGAGAGAAAPHIAMVSRASLEPAAQKKMTSLVSSSTSSSLALGP